MEQLSQLTLDELVVDGTIFYWFYFAASIVSFLILFGIMSCCVTNEIILIRRFELSSHCLKHVLVVHHFDIFVLLWPSFDMAAFSCLIRMIFWARITCMFLLSAHALQLHYELKDSQPLVFPHYGIVRPIVLILFTFLAIFVHSHPVFRWLVR